ncbi:hypothetical protein NW762_009448 [Fusarium torreyae]|uniref:Trimethyllysine dioxygenase n=1 Tax=Fusarium torreyae TaxID=1237075 RepID=A0A9W8VBN4_9HYPO|nr:hypothetical protein NW762_009448 [Fusarium torreyae]
MLRRLFPCSGAGLSNRPAFSVARRASKHAILSLKASTAPLTTTAAKGSSSRPSVAFTETSQICLTRQEQGEDVRRSFPDLWLRDNCQCTQCVNQDTRQRNFDTFQLPKNLRPVRFWENAKYLEVEWSDRHKSQHPWSWLECWFDGGFAEQFGQDEPRKLWGSSIENDPPEVPFDTVMNERDEQGMASITRNIWVHGFSFVIDTPPTPEATKALLEKIGPIRNTHYGGFYDFIPDLALADTAYTNLALPAHTDTTYFSEPAGLQAFHLLSHHAPPNAEPSDNALGGQSLLVDGFNAASVLKEEHPEEYNVLKTVKVPWHASGNKGIAITPDRTYPVIEDDKGEINRIRWNNDDRGVVNVFDAKTWYGAARKWNEILRRRSSEYWFQLTPGRVLIFDNWRVMHGRSAFEGVRRICGAYIPRDDFVSRYRETNFPHETVIGRNLNMRTRRFPKRR